ncbi:hypothetical protein GCM10027040_15020 [Halomonas shantousis]
MAGASMLAAALSLSLVVVAQAQGGGEEAEAYAEGMAAYDSGEYGKALDLVRSMAEQGDARAQYSLGIMYARGQGVSRDDAEAIKWYRKAAQQGLTDAQYALGTQYANGDGVAQDKIQALRWITLAAEAGDRQAQAARQSLEQQMSHAQVQEAQRLAQQGGSQ